MKIKYMIQKITMDIQVAIQVKNSRARKKSKTRYLLW